MKIKTTLVIAACIVLLGTISTQACPSLGSVTLDPAGYGAKGTATINGAGYSNYKVYTGVSLLNVIDAEGDDNPLTAGTTIAAFCCDLGQPAAKNEFEYNVILPEQGPVTSSADSAMGTEKAALLSELWGRFYDEAWASSSSYTSEQKAAAEAFQLCIWEIINEKLGAELDVSVDGSFGDLGFSATDTNVALANSMLAALDGTGTMTELVIVSSSCKQDFITAIPEPATIAILGAGMLMLRSRKRSA